jgi:hypothetical protein
MNADKGRTPYGALFYPRSSAFISGWICFFHNLVSLYTALTASSL